MQSKLKNNTRKLLLIFLFFFVINIAMLIFTEGPIWGLLCLTLWIAISILIPYILLSCLKIVIIKRKDLYRKSKYSNEVFKILRLLAILLAVSLFLLNDLFMGYTTHIKAVSNQRYLSELVDKIVSDAKTDEEKTTKLLEWFDRSKKNMFNLYYLKREGVVAFPLPPSCHIWIFLGEPYIGIRVYNDEDSLWILTSRFGCCGEYALLFRDMANAAGIKVRRVRCLGENHEWDEVYLNGKWIPVDATAVNLPKRNGFVDFGFMERKIAGDMGIQKGNVSFVYAEYLNGTKVDVTKNYTDLANVSILVVDKRGKPLTDVKVKIFSHNRGARRYTGLCRSTNDAGICKFSIGGGVYTIEGVKEGIVSLKGKRKEVFWEGKNYNVTIVLQEDWTKFYIICCLSPTIVIFTIVAIYYLKKKRLEQS